MRVGVVTKDQGIDNSPVNRLLTFDLCYCLILRPIGSLLVDKHISVMDVLSMQRQQTVALHVPANK